MQNSFFLLNLLVSCVFGALSAYFAYHRGRNPYAWFGIGFCFGIFGAFVACFSPERKKILPNSSLKEEPENILGPKDKYWYYLNPDLSQVGPMSLDALTLAWKQGKISPTTYVWHEELAEWKPLREILTNSL